MDRRIELYITKVPKGTKRFVSSHFQGKDGYGNEDPRLGTYNLDPRDNATEYSAAIRRREDLLDRYGGDGYGGVDPKFRRNY